MSVERIDIKGFDINAINPDHYKTKAGLEAIEVIDAFFSENPYLANVFKYIARYGKKGSNLEQLYKAQWWLQHLIVRVEEGGANNG